MVDISTVWDVAESRGDYVLAGGSLKSDDDLVTAVLISLFTDRQAEPDDKIPDGTTDPRGWWGDLGEPVKIGSRLWLLDRSKQTSQVLNAAKDYVAEALQWTIDDGVVNHFENTIEFTRPGMLGIRIIAIRQGAPPKVMNFDWAWQGIA